MSNVKAILADSIDPNFRTALAGNAMLFNAQRWVLISDGADQVPFLNYPITYVISYVNQSSTGHPAIASRATSVQQSTRDWALSGTFEEVRPNWFHVILGSGTLIGSEPAGMAAKRSFNPAATYLNRRAIKIFTANSVNSESEFVYIEQGRRLLGTFIFAHPNNNSTERRIGLGSYPVRADGQAHRADNSFLGYIRSIEWLLRECNTNELRAIFNYGTIYAAHQAGAISIPNLTDLISIDFNRVNGQAPICRPGTKQLTVTPYNDTTPDTLGTTYVDFYSL